MFSWSEECVCCQQPIGDQYVANWPMRGQGVSWWSVVVHHGHSDHTSETLPVKDLLKKHERGKIMFFVKSQCHPHNYQPIASLDKQNVKSMKRNVPVSPCPVFVCQLLFDGKYFSGVSSGSGSSDTASGSDDKCESPTPSGEARSVSVRHDLFPFQPPRHTGAPTRWRGGQRAQGPGWRGPDTSSRRRRDTSRARPAVSHREINCIVLSQFSCQDQINEAQQEIRLHTWLELCGFCGLWGWCKHCLDLSNLWSGQPVHSYVTQLSWAGHDTDCYVVSVTIMAHCNHCIVSALSPHAVIITLIVAR